MLVTEAVLDIFLESYMSQVAGSFPVPSVDLSQWIDLPPSASPVLSFDLQTMEHMDGRLIMGGAVLNQ